MLDKIKNFFCKKNKQQTAHVPPKAVEIEQDSTPKTDTVSDEHNLNDNQNDNKDNKINISKASTPVDNNIVWGVSLDLLSVGDRCRVKIIDVTPDGYFGQSENTMQEVFIPSNEVCEALNLNDEIDVKIYRNYDDILYGSEKRAQTRRFDKKSKLTINFNVGDIVTGHVIGFKDPFYQVQIDGSIFNMLKYRIDCPPLNDFDSYVNKDYDFEVVDIKVNMKTGAPYVELSRKNIALKARQDRINNVKIGDVVHFDQYQVNRGGVEANNGLRIFIPFNQIARNIRIDKTNIDDFLQARNEQDVVRVINKTDDTLICCCDPINGFSLICQQQQTNTLPETVSARVRNVVDYGVFVDLQYPYDVVGLIPYRLLDECNIERLKQTKVGEYIEGVKISDIDKEKQRVTLTM